MSTLLLTISAAFASVVVVDRDVSYIDDAGPLQTLDVYSTLEGNDRPVVIWIHGGGWQIGDKKAMHAKVNAFVAQRGYVLVSVNYRLHPRADYREQASDVAAAIAWTMEHARDYGGSADRIVLMGHSAGAHLAALTLCDPHYLRTYGKQPNALRQVVLLDGAGYDIARQLESARQESRKLYRTVFGEDEDIHQDASPLFHVGQAKLPEFIVAHVASRVDSTSQSKALVAAIQEAGGRAERIAAKGKVHATINRDVGVVGDAFSDRILIGIDRAVSERE